MAVHNRISAAEILGALNKLTMVGVGVRVRMVALGHKQETDTLSQPQSTPNIFGHMDGKKNKGECKAPCTW